MNRVQAATAIQKIVRGRQIRTKPQIIALKRQNGLCPIKMEKITVYNSTTTPCGHAFDTEELMRWLEVSEYRNCPTCREDIVGDHAHNQGPPQTPTTEQNEVVTASMTQGINLTLPQQDHATAALSQNQTAIISALAHLNNGLTSRAELETAIANGITTPYGTISRGIALQLLNDPNVQQAYEHLHFNASLLRQQDQAIAALSQDQRSIISALAHLNNGLTSRAELETAIANGITTPYGTISRGIALQLLNDPNVQQAYEHLYFNASLLRQQDQAIAALSQDQRSIISALAHLNNGLTSRAELETAIANGITTPYGTISRGIALQLLNDPNVQQAYGHLYFYASLLRQQEQV